MKILYAKRRIRIRTLLFLSANIKIYFDTAPYFLQLEQFDEQLPQLQLPLDDFFIFLKIIYPEAITKIAVIIISK